jgi:hypothetical protein
MIAGSRFDIAASGDNFEELFSGLEGVDVRPGRFGLKGRIAFRADAIALEDVQLERQVSDARLGLTVGLGDEQPHLDFDVSADGRDVRTILNRVEGFEAFEQAFSIDARGQLRGPHWKVDKLDIVVGDAALTAAGDLEFAAASKATDFGFALNVPSLAALGTVNGRKFREQGLSLTANVSGGASELKTEEIDLRIGNSDVHGSVRVRKGDVPEIDVDIHSDKLVYLPLLEEITEYEKAPEFDDGRLIPDVDIPFDAMKRVNATLVLDIAEFQRGKLHLSAVDVDARLRDGTLDVDTVQFNTLSGALGARASLAPDGGAGKASLQLVARDFAPGLMETNEDLAMKTDADLDLQSTGADLRTLAGNASGIVYIDIRGGRLQLHEMITAIYGDMLEEMLSAINPLRKTDPNTDFECLIVPLTVTDGKVAGAPSIFVSTEKLRAVTQGSLNLKTEEIRVGVRTTPRRIVSISAAELFNPYVQVVGTLAAPKLAVDEAGVLITGGAAVATGGLTLLARGLWDRLSKAGDACKQVSEQARKELAGRFPDLEIEKPAHQE